MKRHPVRKQVTAHGRGDHAGLNMLYNRCPLCQADLAEVKRQVMEDIAALHEMIANARSLDRRDTLTSASQATGS